MGNESVKLKDSVVLKLYDRYGRLISISEKKPFFERILDKLLSLLEEEPS